MATINVESVLAESPCLACLTPMHLNQVIAQLIYNASSGVAGYGNIFNVSAEFTRPADTTAYAPNDVVGPTVADVLTFVDAARVDGGRGYITNATIVKDETTVTNSLFRLWVYSVAPTPIADNSPYTLLYADRDSYLGYVDFACSTEGTGSDSAQALVTNVNLAFRCAPGSRNLYGVLEAKQAYLPASGENFWIGLTVDQA